jgi:hypothetical protein
MDSILDRLDFYENPKCAIWHTNLTQVVFFVHLVVRLPHKVKISHPMHSIRCISRIVVIIQKAYAAATVNMYISGYLFLKKKKRWYW